MTTKAILTSLAEGIVRYLRRDPELLAHYTAIAKHSYSGVPVDIPYLVHERHALGEAIDYKNWIVDDAAITAEFGPQPRQWVFEAAYDRALQYLAKGHYGLYSDAEMKRILGE